MRFAVEGGYCGDRIGDELGRRQVLVGNTVDEAGIGAVFQQSAHQIRQQIFVRADRRVNAAGHGELVLADHLGVQVIAHAVQALEFEGRALGHLVDSGDGLRVVRGEHRIQRVGGREHLPRTGEVTDVGVRLAGEHRVAAEAVHLRLLDLGIPVGALDQAHRHAPAGTARKIDEEIEHEGRALLVGLHGQAVALPALQRLVGVGAGDHVEREFEPLGFFRVDGETDALRARQLRQFEHARNQLGMHARALAQLVARMQGGELHRNRWCGEHVGAAITAAGPAGADGGDGLAIGLEVTGRILGGESRFAEHVEGIAVGGVFAFARALQRFVDGAAHHELVAHDAHGLAHGEANGGLAHAADQALEGAGHIALGFLGQADQAAGEHQPPGRGIHQHRAGLADVRIPVGVAEFVANQLVGGALIRNAQQGFGHAHQQHAFFRAEVVFAHEGLDHGRVGGAYAGALHQGNGGGLHGGLFGFRQTGRGQQFFQVFGFVAQVGGGDALAQWRTRCGQFGAEDQGHGIPGRGAVEQAIREGQNSSLPRPPRPPRAQALGKTATTPTIRSSTAARRPASACPGYRPGRKIRQFSALAPRGNPCASADGVGLGRGGVAAWLRPGAKRRGAGREGALRVESLGSAAWPGA